MSIIGLPDPEKMHKKSHHRKNDSEELDVFEAAKYFSGAANNNEMHAHANHVHRLHEKPASRPGRFSLDMPARNPLASSHHHHNLAVEKQITIKEKKKHKQPSSPGGKLAHFLNSLFSQTTSRKKKAKSTTTTQSTKDIIEDQSPGWRRKRRSSISHFQTGASGFGSDSKSGSGFRTPPASSYSYNPTKSYKDPRSYSDPKQPTHQVKQVQPDKKHSLDYAWLDEKFNVLDRNVIINRVPEKIIPAKNRFLPEEDDGGDSDSSSDLFELPNYDLDFYSSGLPVYETTNMDSIKRSAVPITSAAR